MFKKLSEIGQEKTQLLTVRSSYVQLHRFQRPREHVKRCLWCEIDQNPEVITSSKERREHYKTACTPWLTHVLSKWITTNFTDDFSEIANQNFPLEIITGDVALVLKIKNKRYLWTVFRDIYPEGYLTPGGCPKNLQELFNPKVLAARECAEEVLICDRDKNVFNVFSPENKVHLEENIKAWKIEPKGIIGLPIMELPTSFGHAEMLAIKHGEKTYHTPNINITVDPDTASVAATIYWEVELPVDGLQDLMLFDGEKSPNGNLLNRTVRLTDQCGEVKALFSNGRNVLSAGWHLPTDTMRMFIP